MVQEKKDKNKEENKRDIKIVVIFLIAIIISIIIGNIRAINKMTPEEKTVAIALRDVLEEHHKIKTPTIKQAWNNKEKEVVLFLNTADLGDFYWCVKFSDAKQKYETQCVSLDPITEYTVVVDFSNTNVTSNEASLVRKMMVATFNRIMKNENEINIASVNKIDKMIDENKLYKIER
jgi:hypothetical protein